MISSPLSVRRSGILLHPTSLPGPFACGDLGNDAYRFVDFLHQAGQTLWQMLPLGVPHDDGSPYQCLSVFAGNPMLISAELLQDCGWLESEVYQTLLGSEAGEPIAASRQKFMLKRAYAGFKLNASVEDRAALKQFISDQAEWIHDYGLYQAVRQSHDYSGWNQWPSELRDRNPQAISDARAHFAEQIEDVYFEQFVFMQQWQALKSYANSKGILMFGDMPIFIAYDSADVWCERNYFDLDEHGQLLTVTGVPPDYFSETGQRWGNPHYRWDVMEADDFQWWKRRVGMQLALFDIIRVDHFRGFESSWEIPADHDTAIHGHWIAVPGSALFDSLQSHFGTLPIVAEDLGIITPEVEALRDRYDFPGMKILQFAFGGDQDNPYLPEHHVANSVVYTGTHDNDTTLGWYQALDENTRHHVHEYIGIEPENDMPWPLIKAALASVANTAIVPMQDLLGLDSHQRMNTPGTVAGNWRWRFDWSDVPTTLAQQMKFLTAEYGRLR